MKKKHGFTLVELLIVAILGSLLVMAAYQVLITNQRAYTVQNTKMEAQQATRAAMEVLFGELREVSAAGGDIVRLDATELEVRVMRTLGVACTVNPGLFALNPQVTVLQVADWFEQGDSVFLFADNDENIISDDTWIKGYVTAIDTTATCSGGEPAQTMSFGGQSIAFLADTVVPGAPVRAFTRFAYGLMTYGDQVYLGRSENGGDWVPLVGPVRDGGAGSEGVAFQYFDTNGNVTNDPDRVRQIVVTVRTWSDVTDDAGRPVLDTLSASIYTRN